MSPEGEINAVKAEPAEDTSSALQKEYTASFQVARADFGVTPDQTITRPPADTYYVNNGTQDWRARPSTDNKFVPPADNRTSDPYFNPNASQPWRANPFKKGGEEFRRPTDPIIPPQDTTDPRFRQTLPDQSYAPQYRPFVPGFVAPNQQFTQFNPQYSPEYNPQFISNNGVPAYSGIGFQFTSNFYAVGERPSFNLTGNMTVVPQGGEIPVIKINTAFPGQKSFFGVPLTTNDAVVTNPAVISGPKVDNTVPLNTIKVQPVQLKFEPGVIPAPAKVNSDGLELLSEASPQINPALVTAKQDERVVVNPAINPVINPISDSVDKTKIASSELAFVPPTQTTNGFEIRPLTTLGDQLLAPQTLPASITGTRPGISTNLVSVPLDQKTLSRADETRTNLYNETWRWTGFTAAVATYWLGGKLPTDTSTVASLASKVGINNINPAINLSAKFRDPAGAIIGVTAYETLNRYAFNLGNPEPVKDSTVAGMTVPAGIMAYRTIAPMGNKWFGRGVALGTIGATYVGDKIFSSKTDTVFNTHTAIDDVATIGGMTAATYIPTPAAMSRIVPNALAGNLLFKGGLIVGSYLIGNGIEYLAEKISPGAKTLAANALASLEADSSTRNTDSLAAARANFSRLSDVQWSAAQSDYAKVKAENDALVPGKDPWEKLAISDRKLLVLGAAIGENYLNQGTQITNKGNTFIGKGFDLDLNQQATIRLTEARNAAYRLIRKYNENVMPATINGTPVNKVAEVEALNKEVERINGLLGRIYAPHDFEKSMPEFVKMAKDKPADFFTTFVRSNADMAARGEQDLKARGFWENPESAEDRRIIAKMHRDRAFALLVVAQNALNLNNGREAVEALRGLPGSNEPAMNAKAAYNAAINAFRTLTEKSPAEIQNLNAIKALYERLNTQIKAKFPDIYPRV